MTAKGAVLGDVVAAAGRDLAREKSAAAGEQLPMFQVPTRHSGDRARHLQTALEEKRGRGRPVGSENKATSEFRKWLIARGKSPLQALMEWSLHSPTSLAAELGCSRLEAFRELRAMWVEMAPYLHSKMVPVDDDGKTPPFFNLVMGGAGAGGADRPPWAYLEGEAQEVQQNQALPQTAPAVSHGDVSHGGDK